MEMNLSINRLTNRLIIQFMKLLINLLTIRARNCFILIELLWGNLILQMNITTNLSNNVNGNSVKTLIQLNIKNNCVSPTNKN